MKANREYIYMRKIQWNGMAVSEKCKNACFLFANVMPILMVIIFQCNLFSWCLGLFHVSRKPFAIHKYLTSYFTLHTPHSTLFYMPYGWYGVHSSLPFQTTTDISLNKTNWTCKRRSHKINDFTFNKMQIKFSEPKLLYFTSGLHFVHFHELNLNVKLELYKTVSILYFYISVTHPNDLRFWLEEYQVSLVVIKQPSEYSSCRTNDFYLFDTFFPLFFPVSNLNGTGIFILLFVPCKLG